MTDIMNASDLNAASNAKDSVGLVDALKDKLLIDAKKLQIDAEKIQINTEKLQIDAEKLQNDAEKNQIDAAKLKIDAAKLKIDAEKLQTNAKKLQINEEKLQIDAEKDADVLETLSPIVRKRVEVLQEIQSQYDALEAKFFEERDALEDRYQKLYETLYTKRYEIVNGIVDVEGVIDESATNTGKEKGVPGFWLNAMNQNDVLVDEIQVRDELALKYLKDIKCSRIVEPKGFKLEFFFESNPFFKNTVLTKTYHMLDEVDPILKKVIGTEIEWFPGRCLTQKTMMKKPKKGSENTNPIIKTAECDSFFNFFKPPEVLDDEDLDGDAAEQLQNLMEADYDIGATIKDKLIPHAVSWFTGEAVEDELELQNGKEEGYVVGVIEG